MESKTVQLQYPVEIKNAGVSSQITSVTLRRIKAKDLKYLPEDGNSNPHAMLPIIGSITGLELSAVEELDMVDVMEIVSIISSFSSAFRETGKNSSGE